MGAALLAVLLLVSLISHQQSDPSLFGPARSGGEVKNSLGLPGAYASSFLVQSFGQLAFWPVPALLAAAWIFFRKMGLTQAGAVRLAGWALFIFALLAALALIWPDWPWPDYGSGGRFGLFLARGAENLLGRGGAVLALPLMLLAGLLMAVNSLWGRCLDLARGWRARPAPKEEETPGADDFEGEEPRNLGLEEEPALIPPPEPRIVEKPKKARPEPKKADPPPDPRRPDRKPGGPYQLPETDLLDDPPPGQSGHASGLSREELMENARLLESKLRDFGVEGRVLEVSGGPVITMYEYQPAPGIKISKVSGLADDLTMAMRAISIRVVAPLPGKAAIGLEIPNPRRSLVSFKEVVESPAFRNSPSILSLVLGVDIMGEPVVADLARMPHLLIAGATGSGKSVALGAMIMSILYKARPDQVRFLMIDPKCVELALYKDIPHLIYPVLSDPSEATLGLKWAVAEMDLRYKLLAEKGVRNIENYNFKIREELKTWKPAPLGRPESPAEEAPRELPFLVIIIDELADLMMVAAKEVEVYITRLAQKARACGIHLILATQRPSVDVLTGIIKANLPTRISFQVSSRIDSRTILDQMGAEKLLGAGDMLFLPPGVGKLRRLHGAYVSDDEIKTVTDYIRDWGPPDYLEDLSLPEAEPDGEGDGERDEKYDEAVELVRRTQKATISHVQRHLRIGYNRAARIIEDMEGEGVIGPQDGTRPRAIF
ncbi:MAG: DNA translocase FtsK [Candidatus Adiutrix sp.]|nr:DNA translocase FtsK [Candidatus Adiutrix sp.]